MPNNKANHTDTRREDWGTPQWLFSVLDSIFHFEIDLAANECNAKCNSYISEDYNFFKVYKTLKGSPWKWCNPPYSRSGCGKWVDALMQLDKVVALLPASVCTKWFMPIWNYADMVVILKGRLRHEGAPGSAQFGSCLAIKGYKGRVDLDLYGISKLRSLGTVIDSAGIQPYTVSVDRFAVR